MLITGRSDGGGGEQNGYGNSVLSAQLCCEPKTALKTKFIDEKKA